MYLQHLPGPHYGDVWGTLEWPPLPLHQTRHPQPRPPALLRQGMGMEGPGRSPHPCSHVPCPPGPMGTVSRGPGHPGISPESVTASSESGSEDTGPQRTHGRGEGQERKGYGPSETTRLSSGPRHMQICPRPRRGSDLSEVPQLASGPLFQAQHLPGHRVYVKRESGCKARWPTLRTRTGMNAEPSRVAALGSPSDGRPRGSVLDDCPE